jgi:hypothetical protein
MFKNAAQLQMVKNLTEKFSQLNTSTFWFQILTSMDITSNGLESRKDEPVELNN